MFNLEYKITDADMRAVNKRLMWSYFVPYLAVSLLGLGAGAAATALRPRTEILVLGILLLVLAAILSVCSILLLIAPKNFVVSALLPSDDIVRSLEIDDGGITVKMPEQSDIHLGFGEIYKVKNYKRFLLLYLDKDRALYVKDAVAGGQSLEEIFAFVKGKVSPQTREADESVPAEVKTHEAAARQAAEETSEADEAEKSEKADDAPSEREGAKEE